MDIPPPDVEMSHLAKKLGWKEKLMDVVDNYATHKHERVRRWLAARPRYHVHYTPTYSSWLNQVEIWFNIEPLAKFNRIVGYLRQRQGSMES